MPGDWTKKLSVGSPVEIPAQWWNNVTDSALAFLRNQSNSRAKPGSASNEGLILVQNNATQPVDRFGVLGIDGIAVAPTPATNLPQFQNRPILNCSSPAIATHLGKFVITAEPISPKQVGRAYVFGYAPVQIQINSPADTAADILDGDRTQLNSGAGGACQILFQPGATGKQWCLVRFEGGSGTLPTGEFVDSQFQVVAQNQAGFTMDRYGPAIPNS